jgi:hypothetical protein
MSNTTEKETVILGVANEGERSYPLKEVIKWKPTKVSKMGSLTYFQSGDTFYSIPTEKFHEIFGLLFGY